MREYFSDEIIGIGRVGHHCFQVKTRINHGLPLSFAFFFTQIRIGELFDNSHILIGAPAHHILRQFQQLLVVLFAHGANKVSLLDLPQ